MVESGREAVSQYDTGGSKMTVASATAVVPIYGRVYGLHQEKVCRRGKEILGNSEAEVSLSAQELETGGRACAVNVMQLDNESALSLSCITEEFPLSADQAQPYLSALNVPNDYCDVVPIKLTVERLIKREIKTEYVSSGAGIYTYNLETGRGGICSPAPVNQCSK